MNSYSGKSTTRTIRLGTILVQRGVLDEHQVQRVLRIQQESGQPFGLLCERLYDIPASKIESAWAKQYAMLVEKTDFTSVDPDSEVLDMVSRRQAWQFRVMPLSWDGCELTMATTPNDLCRALRFANNVIDRAVYFVMASPNSLDEALRRYYPMPGIEHVRRRAA